MTSDISNLIARVSAYPRDISTWDEPGLANDVVAELIEALVASEGGLADRDEFLIVLRGRIREWELNPTGSSEAVCFVTRVREAIDEHIMGKPLATEPAGHTFTVDEVKQLVAESSDPDGHIDRDEFIRSLSREAARHEKVAARAVADLAQL